MPTSITFGGETKNRSCSTLYNRAAELFNKKLASELHTLRSKNPPVNVVLADIYNPLLVIVKNPQSYGNSSFVTIIPSYKSFIITIVINK